jgi:hypothetical protein
MSSLWTPGGEHEVPREPASGAPGGGGEPDGPDDRELDDELDPELAEAEAALRDELDAARERVASAPASQVVANHAMGLYELAAIHLSSRPPHFDDAALAIDALGALVEGLDDRLGEATPVLREALQQIRLAFVQLKAAASPGAPFSSEASGEAPS